MTVDDSIWPSVRVEGDLERARMEWLHTNGAGAYASSTVAQLNTRRYHGLLVAALDPPRDRTRGFSFAMEGIPHDCLISPGASCSICL